MAPRKSTSETFVTHYHQYKNLESLPETFPIVSDGSTVIRHKRRFLKSPQLQLASIFDSRQRRAASCRPGCHLLDEEGDLFAHRKQFCSRLELPQEIGSLNRA